MDADCDEERSVSECAILPSRRANDRERAYRKATIHRDLLNYEKALIEQPPHRQKARQDNSTKHSESCNTRGLLLLAYYRNIVLQMLVDPKATVGNNREEQPASGPSVDKVQLLVSVTRTEERHD